MAYSWWGLMPRRLTRQAERAEAGPTGSVTTGEGQAAIKVQEDRLASRAPNIQALLDQQEAVLTQPLGLGHAGCLLLAALLLSLLTPCGLCSLQLDAQCLEDPIHDAHLDRAKEGLTN